MVEHDVRAEARDAVEHSANVVVDGEAVDVVSEPAEARDDVGLGGLLLLAPERSDAEPLVGVDGAIDVVEDEDLHVRPSS